MPIRRLPRTLTTAPDLRELWRVHPSMQRGYWLFVAACAALAACYLLSPADRFSAESFSIVRAVGGPAVWAPLMGFCAAALVWTQARSLRATSLALRVTSGALALHATGFGIAAATSPRVSLVGPIAFGLWAVLLLSMAAEHRPPPAPPEEGP